jgi:thioredoxin reductase
MEEATFLTKFAKSVTIIHRRDSLRASKIMIDRAQKNKKISFMWNSEVIKLNSDDSGLKSIVVKNNQDQSESVIPADGLFMGIGHKPNTQFLNNQLEVDKHGYLLTKNGGPQTSKLGVFACGDVQDSFYQGIADQNQDFPEEARKVIDQALNASIDLEARAKEMDARGPEIDSDMKEMGLKENENENDQTLAVKGLDM